MFNLTEWGVKKLRDRIWTYINDRVDNDLVLPHQDDIYEAFALEFETGTDFNIVHEVVESYIGIHLLDGVDIQWEGTTNGRSIEADNQGQRLPLETDRRKLA